MIAEIVINLGTDVKFTVMMCRCNRRLFTPRQFYSQFINKLIKSKNKLVHLLQNTCERYHAKLCKPTMNTFYTPIG